MIKTLWSYGRKEIWPRLWDILRGPELLAAVVIGAAFGYWGSHLGIEHSRLGDVLTIVVAYAAVAFGFCLAGLTIALTFPDARFAHDLATARRVADTTTPGEEKKNAYRDLLFVFSWTAVAHWLVIFFGLGLLVTLGFEHQLMTSSVGSRARTGLLITFLTYAGFQFLITLITLSQVGNRYIDRLRKRAAPESA